MTSRAVGAASAQRQHGAVVADEALQPVIVEPDPHPKADQPRGYSIEDLAQDEAAAGGHEHRGFIIVGGSPWRQLAQSSAFQLHHLAATGVAAADEVGDPGAVGVHPRKIGPAAQEQGLPYPPLGMSRRAPGAAVLQAAAVAVAGGR